MTTEQEKREGDPKDQEAGGGSKKEETTTTNPVSPVSTIKRRDVAAADEAQSRPPPATVRSIGQHVSNNSTTTTSAADDLGQQQQQQDTAAATIAMPETISNNQEQIDWPTIGGGDDGQHRERQQKQSTSSGLLYCNREPLKLKDFNAEVRAPMDIEQFAYQAELLLDMNEVAMDNIVGSMLEKVLESEKISSDKLEEAREAIFIRGSSMLIARTIHGTIVSSSSYSNCGGGGSSEQNSLNGYMNDGKQQQTTDTELKHDQSWLCALCNLPQIERRHMVIARFNRAINMGENAREVRLFVLIVVPTQEKGTKREVETGRTFATMLTDYHFRQRLLRANNELEFKSLMMLKAQQLAQSIKLKNRHKYALDVALSHSFSSLASIEAAAATGEKKGSANNTTELLVAARPIRNGGSESDFNNNNNANDDDGLMLKFDKNPRTSKLFDLISLGHGDQKQLQQQHQMIEFKQPTKQPGHHQTILTDSNGSARTVFTSAAKNSTNKCCLCRCFSFMCQHFEFGVGFWGDFKRRLRHYPSDFRDAFVGPPRTLQKTVATIWFLYFGILLPTIAFSSLNTNQTHGHMGDLRKAIIGQAIGGLCFALLGGQPLVIIMTTAPLCLYTKVIHRLCLDYGFPFPAMYAAVGLWNGLFLVVYSLFGFSKLMKWCTRSTEEIFALFIVVAFITDASKDTMKNFKRFYYTPACQLQDNQTLSFNNNSASFASIASRQTSLESSSLEGSFCRRETSLLFLLLMLGTLWLATTLYKFKKTSYLSAGKRELLADYALPTAVIAMSFLGSFVFDEIFVERFPPIKELHFERAQVESLPWTGLLVSLVLGFTLSLLFFMDQNISAAMVNAPQNRLKKGSAYHYDLFVVGILNGFLAVFGLPMMHGVLPHSPLHVRSLADIEERIEEDHLREVIVNCRETRVTAIVSHILVLATLLLIPYPIAYIPSAVLNGLFLYMAITSLDGLQIFERILLLFTEQNKYPPNHYIRRCPQRKIHEFTILQLFQLVIMCLFGFSPINIVEMFFPVIILLMIPFRHKIVPNYIDEKYLNALDGKH